MRTENQIKATIKKMNAKYVIAVDNIKTAFKKRMESTDLSATEQDVLKRDWEKCWEEKDKLSHQIDSLTWSIFP